METDDIRTPVIEATLRMARRLVRRHSKVSSSPAKAGNDEK